MLTMLTCADLCWPMLTNADACRRWTVVQAVERARRVAFITVYCLCVYTCILWLVQWDSRWLVTWLVDKAICVALSSLSLSLSLSLPPSLPPSLWLFLSLSLLEVSRPCWWSRSVVDFKWFLLFSFPSFLPFTESGTIHFSRFPYIWLFLSAPSVFIQLFPALLNPLHARSDPSSE